MAKVVSPIVAASAKVLVLDVLLKAQAAQQAMAKAAGGKGEAAFVEMERPTWELNGVRYTPLGVVTGTLIEAKLEVPENWAEYFTGLGFKADRGKWGKLIVAPQPKGSGGAIISATQLFA